MDLSETILAAIIGALATMGTAIFQLVRKMEPMDADLSEVKHRLQLELFRKKGEQALDRYIADLKKETEIHVHRAILPFDYSGEYRN